HVELAIRIALESTVHHRNFALVQAGARVIPRLTFPNDSVDAPADNAPERALQEPYSRSPTCWSFPGDQGQIGIRLSHKISPTNIVLDVPYKTWTEGLSQAPRQVVLWGVVDGAANQATYEQDLQAYRNGIAHHGSGPTKSLGYTFLALAIFEYDATTAFPIQTYRVADPVIDSQMEFGVIVVEVRSNWGGERTSLCGIRVHGEVV
ncbi:hypothetical protein PYCCODRAFT_1501530, partial [Trametes coccinea BRFM310]